MNSNNNKIVGRLGESKACDFLIKNMYTILERNYSTKIGEVDIIAKQAGVIVFVEVKRSPHNSDALVLGCLTEALLAISHLVHDLHAMVAHS